MARDHSVGNRSPITSSPPLLHSHRLFCKDECMLQIRLKKRVFHLHNKEVVRNKRREILLFDPPKESNPLPNPTESDVLPLGHSYYFKTSCHRSVWNRLVVQRGKGVADESAVLLDKFWRLTIPSTSTLATHKRSFASWGFSTKLQRT